MAGRKKANHSLCAMFLMPCSPKVGTSGAKRLRLAPDTPRMRTLPDCRCCVMSPMGPDTAEMLPPRRSSMAGCVPR
ncbi:hypothetical protein D9M69_665080 [compost metagenome]